MPDVLKPGQDLHVQVIYLQFPAHAMPVTGPAQHAINRGFMHGLEMSSPGKTRTLWQCHTCHAIIVR